MVLNNSKYQISHTPISTNYSWSVINFLLLIIKFAFGIMLSSYLLLIDSLETISVFFTDIMSVIFTKKLTSKKKALEVFFLFLCGFILVFLISFLVISGFDFISKYLKGTATKKISVMVIFVELFSIATKELLYRCSSFKAKKQNNPTIMANAWYRHDDMLLSLFVLSVSAIIILSKQNFIILDPLFSIIIALFNIKIPVKLFLTAGNIFFTIVKTKKKHIYTKIEKIIYGYDVKNIYQLTTTKLNKTLCINACIEFNSNLNTDDKEQIFQDIEENISSLFDRPVQIFIYELNYL